MSLLADILLVLAGLGLGVYCIVLSKRLSRFTDLENGVGGAVAVLSAQVDDLTRALRNARETAHGSVEALNATTARAEDAAHRLELHVAALHDLPAAPEPPSGTPRGAEAPLGGDFGRQDAGEAGQNEDAAGNVADGQHGDGANVSVFSSRRRIQTGLAG